MNIQAIFAETINNIGSNTGHMTSECENFGMTYGCKPECPVFMEGRCELQEENQKKFLKEGM